MPAHASQRRRAFTLLELIVTLVVIAVAAAVAIPTFQRVVAGSEMAAAQAEQDAVARDAAAILALRDGTTPTGALELALAETYAFAVPGVNAAAATFTVITDGTPSTARDEVSAAVTADHLAWAVLVSEGEGVQCRVGVAGANPNCWPAKGDGVAFTGAAAAKGPPKPPPACDKGKPTNNPNCPTTTTTAPTTTTTSTTTTSTTTTTVPALAWVDVAAGENHSFAIAGSGALFAWGQNTRGQLGVGDKANRSTPTVVAGRTDWAQVSGGEFHSAAITAGGELYAWGYNTGGQLGVGDRAERLTPTRVGSRSDWAQVSAGKNHTVAITDAGELFAWGWNTSGALGINSTSTGWHVNPIRVGDRSDWAKVISTGSGHNLALTTGGELYAWGYNNQGGLGVGDEENRLAPTRVGAHLTWADAAVAEYFSVAVTTDGHLYAWGPGRIGHGGSSKVLAPLRVGTRTDWAQVSAGDSHGLGITTAGVLHSWGSETGGALGHGDTVHQVPSRPNPVGAASNWVRVAGGGTHTVAVSASGELFTWGTGTFGQLGLGDTTFLDRPTDAG